MFLREDRPRAKGVWTSGEHERFLEAIAMYPRGPWSLITDHVGTRSAKQVQTHAQKYQHKLMRHKRGLLKRKTKTSRIEHRVDTTTAEYLTNGFMARLHNDPSPAKTRSWETPTTSLSMLSLAAESTSPNTDPSYLIGGTIRQSRLAPSSSIGDHGSSFGRSLVHKRLMSCNSPTGLETSFRDSEPSPFHGQVELDDWESYWDL